MDIHNKVALVTGGAHRVGKAIAMALVQTGAHIAITYNTSSDKAQATADEINRSGGKATAFQCDQQQLESIDQLFRSLRNEFDHLDIAINSAAIMARQPALDITSDDWARVIDTNLRGPFFIAQAAAKWMLEAGVEGSIVNIADLSALQPWPSYLAHTISKRGVIAMTQALALAVAPSIRVNAIAPGAILKPDEWDDARWLRLIDSLPLKHSGTLDDVANAVLFCLQADFMTGQTIIIDGGRSLK